MWDHLGQIVGGADEAPPHDVIYWARNGRRLDAADPEELVGLDLSALPSGRYAVPDGETRLKVRVDNLVLDVAGRRATRGRFLAASTTKASRMSSG